MSISNKPRSATPRPSFERGTGFLLSRLGAMASRWWSEVLREHGLTLNEYTSLVVTSELGPLGQVRLAQLVAIDPRNVVAVIDALAAGGLVQRDVDPDDGRRRVVTVTAAGRRRLDAVATRAATTSNEFLDALNRREQHELNRLLQRVYDSLTAEE
jgi:DNA-binding MarR family transcriptional regulator